MKCDYPPNCVLREVVMGYRERAELLRAALAVAPYFATFLIVP
jgi:hypothetical protein